MEETEISRKFQAHLRHLNGTMSTKTFADVLNTKECKSWKKPGIRFLAMMNFRYS